MEQSKLITYILVFLLGFIISKIIPDLCDKLYQNSIIEQFIIGGQATGETQVAVDQEIQCIPGIDENNCGACFTITEDSTIYTTDPSNLTRDACLIAGNNWLIENTEGTPITYSHGLVCNQHTYQCDEPCSR
jgi:hypothetical protein